MTARLAENGNKVYPVVPSLDRDRMRIVPLLVIALLLAGSIAGCADNNNGAKKPESASLKEAEKAANDLDVQATDTTGVIRGVVVDDALRPLAGAAVQLQGGGNATTNEAGAFGFDGLEAGTYFLSASKDGYATIQQAVEVVAGNSNPDTVKVLLAAVARATPFVEALSAKMFISGSAWVDGGGGVTVGGGGVLSDGNWNFQVNIQPNGTIAQTEMKWDATSPLGENGRVSGGTYSGSDGVDTATKTGPQPFVIRANATEKTATSDNVYYSFYAWPSAGTPVGLAFNQQVDVFVHVFHNFTPRDDWIFSRDGDYPVPP